MDVAVRPRAGGKRLGTLANAPARCEDRLPAIHCWRARSACVLNGGVVQLKGSVVENPQGLHLKTFRFSPKARLIVRSTIIGRPQTGQMTSFVDVTSSLMMRLWMRWQVPAMTQINSFAIH
jgi:hypothetical protein